VIFGCLWSAIASTNDPIELVSNRIEFERGATKKEAQSPNGKTTITMLPPANEDTDPRIDAVSGNKKFSLGGLRRSAYVFWRPDSQVAVLWDLAYSNHYFVRLISAGPKLSEVKGFDRLIKQRVLKEFHPAQLVHYWPHVEGWTKQNELVVVVCADGVLSRSPQQTSLQGFERGYLIDTNKAEIRAQFDAHEILKIIGTNPCE